MSSAKLGGVQALIGQHVKRDVPYIHVPYTHADHKLHLVVVHVATVYLLFASTLTFAIC